MGWVQQHAPRHAALHQKRWLPLPLVFGLCVILLVGSTWISTHRSFTAAGHSPSSSDPWPPSRAARFGQAAAASDSRQSGGSTDNTAASNPSGSTLEDLLGALAVRHGVGSSSSSSSTAAGAAGSGAGDHIELHADRVAAVVGRAKAAESLAQLQAGPDGDMAASQDSAGRHQDLYHRGAGGLLLGPLEGAESAACPPGTAPPRGGQTATALVVLAGAGSAGQLGSTLRELLGVLGRAEDEARTGFHAFVAVDTADPMVKQVAVHYAAEAMGALRVIHHGHNATAAAAAADTGEKCSNDPGRPGHQIFLLRLLLECLGYPAVLVLGTESRLSPDAPAFFSSAQWLLRSDHSLFCIGGGSLVGAAQAAADPRLVLRSDAPPAPSCGWLVPARVGLEVLQQWRSAVANGTAPQGFEDNTAGWLQFLASPGLWRGRQCLLPDLLRVWGANATGAAAAADGAGSGGAVNVRRVPTPAELARQRNATFESSGLSEEHGDESAGAWDWSEEDLSWVMEPGYSRLVMQKLRMAVPSTLAIAVDAPAGSGPYRVFYDGEKGYKAAMAALGLPVDVTLGRKNCYPVPAGSGAGAGTREHCQAFLPPLSYRGIVPIYNTRGARVFLVPLTYAAALGSSSSSNSPDRAIAAPSHTADAGAAAHSTGSVPSGVLSSGGTVIHVGQVDPEAGGGGGLPTVEGLDNVAALLAEVVDGDGAHEARGPEAQAAAGSGVGTTTTGLQH